MRAEASHLPPPVSSIKIKLPVELEDSTSTSNTNTNTKSDTRSTAVDKKKKDKAALEKLELESKTKEGRKVVKGVYCHVQTSNLVARAFWERMGFVIKVCLSFRASSSTFSSLTRSGVASAN